jgi:Fur family transcriptional regulator, ferric uptake regulator
VVLESTLHETIGLRFAGAEQRYTAHRRQLIDVLAEAGRPLTVPEILAAAPSLTQSSAYRNVMALIEVGVVERIAGTDEHGRYELAEALTGHHHHVVCESCGKVEDLIASPKLERALGEAARIAAEQQGYEITEHRLDLYGRCEACRAKFATLTSPRGSGLRYLGRVSGPHPEIRDHLG